MTSANRLDVLSGQDHKVALLIHRTTLPGQGLLSSVRLRAVVAMHVSAAGAPLAVLSNRTAHTFHRGMRCWMCVADTAFPASAFHSILAPASGAPRRPPVALHSRHGLVMGVSLCEFKHRSTCAAPHMLLLIMAHTLTALESAWTGWLSEAARFCCVKCVMSNFMQSHLTILTVCTALFI